MLKVLVIKAAGWRKVCLKNIPTIFYFKENDIINISAQSVTIRDVNIADISIPVNSKLVNKDDPAKTKVIRQ